MYMKVNALSNTYYNKGLSMAKANDLTGAAERLERSVAFNKRNTKARNLLGLVYCTTGLVGEALKQWVISLSFQAKDNPADGYLAVFQKQPRKLEGAAEAVRLYNQSIVYLKQKSEDMAIIRLKRAVDLNPDFVDAQCLLALAYMLSKDKTRAIQCVERVLAKDEGNPIAWRYYKELNRGRAAADARKTAAPEVKAEKTVGYPLYPGNKRSGLPISGIICFIVGALCAFAVVYILYLPQQINEREQKITSLQDQITGLEGTYKTQLSTKDETIVKQEQELKALQDGSAALEREIALQERVMKVYAALSLHRQEKYEEAVSALETIVTTGLPADVMETYAFIGQNAREILEARHYTAGLAHYAAWRYAEAKPELETAAKYVAEDSKVFGDLFYMLGRIAESENDSALALLYYEQSVLQTDSPRYATSQGRVNVLKPIVEKESQTN